jgi:hypothetical protein
MLELQLEVAVGHLDRVRVGDLTHHRLQLEVAVVRGLAAACQRSACYRWTEQPAEATLARGGYSGYVGPISARAVSDGLD